MGCHGSQDPGADEAYRRAGVLLHRTVGRAKIAKPLTASPRNCATNRNYSSLTLKPTVTQSHTMPATFTHTTIFITSSPNSGIYAHSRHYSAAVSHTCSLPHIR